MCNDRMTFDLSVATKDREYTITIKMEGLKGSSANEDGAIFIEQEAVIHFGSGCTYKKLYRRFGVDDVAIHLVYRGILENPDDKSCINGAVIDFGQDMKSWLKSTDYTFEFRILIEWE